MELEKFTKKMSLIGLRLQKSTIIIGAILSVVFFLLAVDSFKVYQSDVLILVKVKSPVAIKQQNQIFNNILQFPQTLAFYDTMLFQNTDVRDVAKDLSGSKRQEKWNEMISVSKINEDSSIFKITLTSKFASDSRELATKSARTLFDTIAFYYDIKKDFDLRIIDGPTSSVRIANWFGLLVMSLFGGYGVSILLGVAFSSKKEEITIIEKEVKPVLKEKENTTKEESENMAKNLIFDFGKKTKKSVGQGIESLRRLYQSDATFVFPTEKDLASNIEVIKLPQVDPRITEMKKLTKQIEPAKYPNFPEMPAPGKVKSSAPDNLPIADENFSVHYSEGNKKQEEIFSEVETEFIEEKKGINIKKEPTPEELKERLNQLLRGDF